MLQLYFRKNMTFINLKPLIRCINVKGRCSYSTEALAATQSKPSRCRTVENNPVNHHDDHLGKFYTMPDNVKKRLFFRDGLPKNLMLNIDVFKELSIMVREPALEIMYYLKTINYSCPAIRFVIYGNIGTGKTLTLAHLLHFGFQQKYVLVHVPWVSRWTRRAMDISDSQSRPGRIDLPREAIVWLNHFKLQNQQLLQELDLRTTQTYTWSQRESTEENQPLLDVVEHGLKRGPHASDCIAVLMKEIKKQSSSGRYKTLVLVDGANAIYDKPNIWPSKREIKSTEMTMVRAVEKLLRNDWNNAAVVITVDSLVCKGNEVREIRAKTCFNYVNLPFTPRSLLGKEGFEVLDPFIPICVDNYTDKEVESALDYYTDVNWIQLEMARSERGRAELKFLSGRNPYEMMKLCDTL